MALLREVEITAPAHGGHAVGRHEGRVVFVRHTAPGEVVDVEIAEDRADARFWRGDAVTVHRASPDRVPHVWPEAGPGGVGGAELGHLSLPAQRAWKREVVRGTLRRIGGLELDLEVAPAPSEIDGDGLRTRTRIHLVADADGRPAMHRHRSHDLVALEDMPLAVEEIAAAPLWHRRTKPGTRIDVAAGTDGVVVLLDGEPMRGTRRAVRERVELPGRRWDYRVAADGFWQVHRDAPAVLVERVLEAADARSGQRVLELYSGAGLLTLPLADAVGPTGAVTAVEGSAAGVRAARRTLHDRGWVDLVQGDVQTVTAGLELTPDVVVLDPPRAGAGRAVVETVLAARPRRVVLVACDPAALARDLRTAVDAGWQVTSLTGHDLFPHTHHVEAVAVLEPGSPR